MPVAMPNPNIRVCARCVYDETVPLISFDEGGVCNYCHTHDEMEREYPTGEQGAAILRGLAGRMRRESRGKYDCIVGVSGGCDSSYLLYRVVELGLRPLAVHFDNTWNSPISTVNIYKMCRALGVDLFTHVVDNMEYDDIYRSFICAGVADIDCPTDIGFASTLYMAARKYNVSYIFEGHSFRTEGISPLGWLYMDGKYIETVQKTFGTRPIKTFPNLTLAKFLYYSAFLRLKRIRPLYYMDYVKADAMEELKKKFGWKWYGGHHLDNRFTAFYHRYFLVRRFGIDGRMLGHAAMARSGQMDRDVALAELKTPPEHDHHIVQLVKKRLGYSDEDFESLMTAPKHTYRDYKTYKKTFEKLRPLFWILYKLELVPKSFYMKFTARSPN